MDNPPAWHPDPAGTHDHRWWDGQRWTEHVADAGVASVDPLPDAPGDAGAVGTGSTPVGGTEPTSAEPSPPETSPAPEAGSGVWGADNQGGQAGQGGAAWGGAPASGTSWDQQASWSGDAGSNGMAVGALVTGILSLPLLMVFGLGAILGIVAVILGIIAIRRANRGAGGGRGMAIGGIVTGAISAVLGIVIVIFFVSFGTSIVNEMEACLEETGGDQAECQQRLEDQLTERFLND